MYDLRSDTITKPTDAMRKAMADAPVGDDVYHEDPTVNRLEAMGREITGKEESLFVSSGCMGNLIALMIWGGRGKEVLCANESHIIQHEIGAVSAIANTIPIIVPSIDGIIEEERLEEHIRPRAYDMGESAIIEVENTTSGLVYPIGKMQKIKRIAEKHAMRVHLDGARIFNASVASGISVAEYAKEADDITFCLSKGLGAIAGSLLSGSREFIQMARTYRKMLGGGMRQIGIVAASGIYALNHHVERLEKDHSHATAIAEALSHTSWAKVKIASTNMVFFETECVNDIIARLREKDVLILSEGRLGRMVTNLGISDEDTDRICHIIEAL